LRLSAVSCWCLPQHFYPPTPSWKTRWEQTVEAAKKEGQITVYGSVDGENEAIKLAEEALLASKKK
jgi:hypothetical protein